MELHNVHDLAKDRHVVVEVAQDVTSALGVQLERVVRRARGGDAEHRICSRGITNWYAVPNRPDDATKRARFSSTSRVPRRLTPLSPVITYEHVQQFGGSSPAAGGASSAAPIPAKVEAVCTSTPGGGQPARVPRVGEAGQLVLSYW